MYIQHRTIAPEWDYVLIWKEYACT